MPRNPQDIVVIEDIEDENDAKVYVAIHNERARAHRKHGAAGNSREEASWDNVEWLPILMEELGEIAHQFTYDVEMDIMDLREELVQLAAMSAAWIASIDEMAENPDGQSE